MSTRVDFQPGTIVGRFLIPSVVAALALAALFAIYRDLDFRRFSSAFVGADKTWLIVLAGVILLEQAVRAWKWRQILREVKPVATTSRLFGAILASYGLQLVVPVPVTPLARAWFIARLEKLTVATVLSTIAVDRYVDAIVFALFIGFVGTSGLAVYIGKDLQTVLIAVAVVQGVMFAGFAYGLFRARTLLQQDESHPSRVVDWLARQGGRRFDGLREGMVLGMVWPREWWRQAGVILASGVMKFLAASQFLWAGLAIGIVLAPVDYLFLMVFSGLALLAATFVRVPGLYFFVTVMAFDLVGLGFNEAFAILILIRVTTMACMLGPGFIFGWNAFVAIRQDKRSAALEPATA